MILNKEIDWSDEKPQVTKISDEFMAKLEALDDFMLLSMYFTKQEERDNIAHENNALRKNLDKIVDPQIVENLYDYKRQIDENQGLRDNINSTIKSNEVRWEMAEREKNFIVRKATERDSIPQGLWIKIGDNAISIYASQRVDTCSWRDAVADNPEIQKKERKNELSLTALGVGTSILFAGTTTAAAGVLFNPLTGLMVLCIWIIVGKFIDNIVQV